MFYASEFRILLPPLILGEGWGGVSGNFGMKKARNKPSFVRGHYRAWSATLMIAENMSSTHHYCDRSALISEADQLRDAIFVVANGGMCTAVVSRKVRKEIF